MRCVDEAERRARIARRHGIDPARRCVDPESATRAMTVLHATEPASVVLSLVARVDDLTMAEVDRALYDERTLVKQLAMRRTLFVFPRDLLPAAWGSASARVAGAEWRRTSKDVAAAGLAEGLAVGSAPGGDAGDAWLEAACAAVLARLEGTALTGVQLRAEVPEIAGSITISPGRPWGGDVPVAPRVMTQLGLRGLVVRGRNAAAHWRTSKPTWTLMSDWLGETPAPLEARAGYAELVRRWLWTFGPGTAVDLQWWLGGTVSVVRQALADVEAVEVELTGDPAGTGWVLPDDLPDDPADDPDRESPVEPWAALLPVLDPTVMGWKQRGFLLGPHGPELFDRNGNAGTTAWWDGRIVGGWVQDPDAVVHVELLEDVGSAGRAALAVEAERLTSWLDGVRVATVYPSPLMKRVRDRSG